jgi:hypothetical protein
LPVYQHGVYDALQGVIGLVDQKPAA